MIMRNIETTSYKKGRAAEELAFKYLDRQGLKLLTRNYRSRRGEIDLIMQDGDVIVFIEVRSRKNNRTMDVIESINPEKCERIIRTGRQYLQNSRHAGEFTCRFDIVLITGQLESAEIEWIKNAFEA